MPSEKDLRQAEYFRNRVTKNEKTLRRWARREGVEALRLYDRDIPEVPLALDRYGDALLLSLYERPYEKDEKLEESWLDLMADMASDALGADRTQVFFRTRRRQRGDEQYEKLSHRRAERTICEGGSSFLVNLSDYLDTGLFLDHRPTRAMVKADAGGKRVLNLFSYTGSFSVYAARGGASSVTSVDLSKTYLDWAARNFELNGISLQANPLVRGDAMRFLENAANSSQNWDLIVADPPTFSNSKAAREDFDVGKDWPRLIAACVNVLSPKGCLYFSTNSRNLVWSSERARELALGASWEDISSLTIPPDFRNRAIHRCWRLRL